MRYLQTEAAECGLISLLYALSKFGSHLDVAELRRRFPVSGRGLTLRQLSDIATELDLQTRAIRCEIHELRELKLPAILHWKLNHFVVLERVSNRGIVIHDPAHGKVHLTFPDVSRQFTGVALELSQTPAFKKRREKSSLPIRSWIRLTPQLYTGFAQVLIISVVLQIYVIASPFYMQLAVDQGALKGDVDLLTTLALGFGLFGLFNVFAAGIRSLAMQHIAVQLGWDMGVRLFNHMVRLPLGWFQRRRLADTISRFDALTPIRDLVSGALIAAVIDGALAATTLLMMFLFFLGSWVCACVRERSFTLRFGLLA